jgi:hypothetical protein
MPFVRLALRNPHAVAVLALAILILGLTALGRLPVDILPQFETPAVQVLTLYPGMPAEVVEKDITTRLERWTGQANGIVRQESKSMIGVSAERLAGPMGMAFYGGGYAPHAVVLGAGREVLFTSRGSPGDALIAALEEALGVRASF